MVPDKFGTPSATFFLRFPEAVGSYAAVGSTVPFDGMQLPFVNQATVGDAGFAGSHKSSIVRKRMVGGNTSGNHI